MKTQQDRVEEAQEPIGSAKPEVQEFNNIYHQARLARFMAVMSGEHPSLDGAELEMRSAVFGDADSIAKRGGRAVNENSIPIHMFLPMEPGAGGSRRRRLYRIGRERYAHLPPNPRQDLPVLHRTVRRGELHKRWRGPPRGSLISAPALPSPLPPRARILTARTATITFEDSDPIEGAVAYRSGRSTMLRFAEGVYEGALRADARGAITDGTDTLILRGNAGPLIRGLLTGGALANDADATAVITALEMVKELASRVDGEYARLWTDSRILVRPEAYTIAIASPIGTNGDRLGLDLLGPDRMMASKKLTAPDASDRHQAISYSPVNDTGNLMVPIWDDVEVIYDNISFAAKREIRWTFNVAMNVHLLRNDPWKKHSIKTA